MAKLVFPDIELSNVKGVLSDLDNTLYNFDVCHAVALKSCYSIYDFGMTFDAFKARYVEHRRIIIEKLNGLPACRSRALVFQNMFESMGKKHPFIDALRFSDCYWRKFLSVMKVDVKALAFLKDCKKRKIPVCLVTDMLTEIQIKKVKKLRLVPYIAYIASSEEATVEKPDAAIFDLAMSKLGLSASDVIMIGDNPDKDIKGADALNIKSYLVKMES